MRDPKVTGIFGLVDIDLLLSALAHPTRRELLNRLLHKPGQSAASLGANLGMSRFGVAKHLRILNESGLIDIWRDGREHAHVLVLEPLRYLYERWLKRFLDRDPYVPGVRMPQKPKRRHGSPKKRRDAGVGRGRARG